MTSTSSDGGGTEVYLAVYDLSKGMARGLSQQFLGVAIDLIPHTGLVVFGKEWFFGGGIQAVEPNIFRTSSGMQPIQTIRLGRTTVSHEEFERWCRPDGVGGRRFHPSSYDLLQKNCNHFSHEAALEGLRLPNGVPEWILDVPRMFLSSPMGQMVRPMLEQMQVTQSPAVHGQGATGFSSSPSSSSPSSQPAVRSNPWANIPTQQSKQPRPPQTPISLPNSTSVLNKYKVPMLSNDKSTFPICKKKLSQYFESTNDERVIQGWKKLCMRLENGRTEAGMTDGKQEPDLEAMNACIQYLWAYLLRNPDNDETIGNMCMFILLVLRLIVLVKDLDSFNILPSEDNDLSSSLQTASANSNVRWIVNQMNHGHEKGWKSPATRSAAWCVLSNSLTSSVFLGSKQKPMIDEIIPQLVDAAIVDTSSSQQPKVEVRHAASAFLYNLILFLQRHNEAEEKSESNGDDLDDITVSILCSNLDGSIEDEKDETTRLRRLLVVARILSPIHGENKESSIVVAKSLALDLGLEEFLKRESERITDNECCKLAGEVLTLLQ